MAPNSLDSIYFDSLSQLVIWHDNLVREYDSGQDRLDKFRRSSEDIDAYQIGDPDDKPTKILPKGRPRPSHSFSASESFMSCPSSLTRKAFSRIRSSSTDTTSRGHSHSFPSKRQSYSTGHSDIDSYSSESLGNEFSSHLHRAKLMVCHDFKNGYQQGHDKRPNGYYPHPSGSRYFIQYPQLLDSFIYFSHHRVTVPPVSWINMCHRNCIKCFGTIIFEGSSYSTELDRLVQLGRDGEFVFVEILVELVQCFGFDGYLINIETCFSNGIIAQSLIPFLENLKAKLHTKHLKNEVIWYDSYLYPYNKTYYVNGVNDLNFNFFSSTDRTFTNYWWNLKTLRENMRNVGLLGVQNKLYIGYDVWGRGSTVGKGGFDSSLACQLISKYKSNVALFAPAWTYEQLGPKNFVRNDTRFWVGLFEEELSIMSSIKPHSCPVFKTNDSSFVFYTNFCNGQGHSFTCKGIKIFNKPWVDGNLQWYLPLALNRTPTLGLQMKLETAESFHTGSCLQVSYVPYLEDKANGSSGYRIFSEQQVRRLQLFDLNKICRFNTIGVRLSYKLRDDTEEIFKVKVKYHIEKKMANKSIQISRIGYLVIPLGTTKGSWYTLDNAFNIDTDTMETIVMESIDVEYDNENMGQSSDGSLYRSYVMEDSVVTSVIDNEQYEKVNDKEIYNDDERERWVIIPRLAEDGVNNAVSSASFSTSTLSAPESSPALKIGEIAVINANNYPSANFFGMSAVTKVKKLDIKEDGMLFVWSGSKNNYVLYYVIYINDIFKGTSQISQFYADDDDDDANGREDTDSISTTNFSIIKIRVDTIDKLGSVYPGSEVFV
ncbi:hypothetical protein FOA43_004308 [Brettanomyces nanus]|uniref:Cytosolic endo-beta-N-acetylglucosaminidase TIM barrel domain-containing protein n=1 Tax=Eeniella nana TaxID=13502 RepID=A0A875SE19_EENNA|nr:uncharacterized protein FOA43_004308 [Brettanomyces nanus]QPG76914.1 hypothetical protein FOA43_004308 [Brettanomyces nanus]